jgi:hypothetical protein
MRASNKAPPHTANANNAAMSSSTALMMEPAADGWGLNPPHRGHRFASEATGWYWQ